MDFEAAHSIDLDTVAPSLTGRFRSRLLVTYVKELIEDDGVTRTDSAGLAAGGIPHWRGTLDGRYELDRLSISLRARYVGGGVRSRFLTVDQNYIDSQIYADLGLEYRTSLLGDLSLYGNVVNLFDRDAPPAPTTSLHDVIGRSFNVGVRMVL